MWLLLVASAGASLSVGRRAREYRIDDARVARAGQSRQFPRIPPLLARPSAPFPRFVRLRTPRLLPPFRTFPAFRPPPDPPPLAGFPHLSRASSAPRAPRLLPAFLHLSRAWSPRPRLLPASPHLSRAWSGPAPASCRPFPFPGLVRAPAPAFSHPCPPPARRVLSPQSRSPQVRSPQSRSPQVRSPQVRSPQSRSPQVRSPQGAVTSECGHLRVRSPQSAGHLRVRSPRVDLPQPARTGSAVTFDLTRMQSILTS